MNIGKQVAEYALLQEIIEQAQSYKNSNELWNDCKNFGQFVIERLQEFTELEFEEEEEN